MSNRSPTPHLSSPGPLPPTPVHSLSIFIPAFNASEYIGKVIRRIPPPLLNHVKRIYIINDGSTDSTAEAIENLSRSYPQIHPVHFEKNQGYGTVVKKGLDLCKSDKCDYAVCLHADGQYPPEKIQEMIQAMRADEFDLIQGSRLSSKTALSGGMPLYKYIAGVCLVKLENIVFKMNMTDYHSGFLIYRRSVLETVPYNKLSSSFDIDLEIIASCRAHGLRIGEYPIPTRYADETSHLKPVNYGLQVLKVLFKYIRGAYRS